jgi:hypothetical protein
MWWTPLRHSPSPDRDSDYQNANSQQKVCTVDGLAEKGVSQLMKGVRRSRHD